MYTYIHIVIEYPVSDKAKMAKAFADEYFRCIG